MKSLHLIVASIIAFISAGCDAQEAKKPEQPTRTATKTDVLTALAMGELTTDKSDRAAQSAKILSNVGVDDNMRKNVNVLVFPIPQSSLTRDALVSRFGPGISPDYAVASFVEARGGLIRSERAASALHYEALSFAFDANGKLCTILELVSPPIAGKPESANIITGVQGDEILLNWTFSPKPQWLLPKAPSP